MSCTITLCPECRSFQKAGGNCTICRAPVKPRTLPPTAKPANTPADPPRPEQPTGDDVARAHAA